MKYVFLMVITVVNFATAATLDRFDSRVVYEMLQAAGVPTNDAGETSPVSLICVKPVSGLTSCEAKLLQEVTPVVTLTEVTGSEARSAFSVLSHNHFEKSSVVELQFVKCTFTEGIPQHPETHDYSCEVK